MIDITQQELKSILDYDPETGIFKYKKRNISSYNHARYVTRFNRHVADKEAGSLHSDGYLVARVAGKIKKLHRVA